MSAEEQDANYRSHRFVTRLAGGDPAEAGSYERVRVCEACGCEDAGDPAEFPELFYPDCGDEDTDVLVEIPINWPNCSVPDCEYKAASGSTMCCAHQRGEQPEPLDVYLTREPLES